MANTTIPTFIPHVSTSQQTISVLSPGEMMAIDMRVSELRYAYDHDMEMSDEDCKALGFIDYCERMQVFEPFDIKQFDVIDALKKYDLIEQDRPDVSNYTKEESIALKDILLRKWDEIDFDMKVLFHAINGSLPCWSYLYPAPKQFIENAKDWINREP
jgi:hypothetical protein